MRRLGGIWKHVKITYAVMWIGTLALVGFPGFAGFFSKDAVLEAAWASHYSFHYYAFWMGELAAFLTAFYSGRLMWLTSAYWMLTGVHGAHVMAGLGALMLLFVRLVRARDLARVEPYAGGVSLYWHMVDAVWVAVFLTIWVVQ